MASLVSRADGRHPSYRPRSNHETRLRHSDFPYATVRHRLSTFWLWRQHVDASDVDRAHTHPSGDNAVSRVEVIPFQTLTLTDQEFLSGREDGTPVTVAGELRPPRAGTDRLPLVIILHPAGGIGSNIVDWEQDLLGLGIATFVVLAIWLAFYLFVFLPQSAP